jgi:hypothetical protein
VYEGKIKVQKMTREIENVDFANEGEEYIRI